MQWWPVTSGAVMRAPVVPSSASPLSAARNTKYLSRYPLTHNSFLRIKLKERGHPSHLYIIYRSSKIIKYSIANLKTPKVLSYTIIG